MQVLVTFCNVTTPGQPAWGLLDPETLTFQPLRLPSDVCHCGGIRGVALSPDYLYAVVQEGPLSAPGLLVLQRDDLSLVNHYLFRGTGDVHSLLLEDDRLYAVSTGSDEVLELHIRGAGVLSERVIWRPDPECPRLDVHHMNSICRFGGGVLVSGFGRRAGEKWSTALNGFIHDVTRDRRVAEGIQHPHSLFADGDRLLYCESRSRTLRSLDEETQQRLPGYTRGICRIGAKLFVGTSTRRQVSKSTGLFYDPPAPGASAELCSVSRLDEAWSIEQTVDLGMYGEEIYELLPVEGVEAWPVVRPEDYRPFEIEWQAQVKLAMAELAAHVGPGESVILVDDEKLGLGRTVFSRRRLPFLERNGEYFGRPVDDNEAIAELERLRRSGAASIAFAWPSFWWLEHYAALNGYLRTRYTPLVENERLVVFRLAPVAAVVGADPVERDEEAGDLVAAGASPWTSESR